jgi:Arc/MetJ-type ribon-helix-helix transcriptional regulator
MRIIANLNPDVYDEVEELVKTNGYSSVDQFIRSAVQNQLTLEREGKSVRSEPTEDRGHTDPFWKKDIPANPPLADAYRVNRDEKLLFQQYYRFFPLIVVMAEVARVTSRDSEPIALDKFRSHMEEEVVRIRDPLRDWEAENDVKKTERKSTGLPKSDVKNPDYSMKRFLDHYVGRVRKRDNQPLAIGSDLKFISYRPLQENDGCLVQLTPAGNELLQLGNPILNNGPEAATLSDDERRCIAKQIRDVLPEEYSLMKFVYEVLDDSDGDTYTNYLNKFESFLLDSPGFSDDDPSEDRVRSATAGVLSRMVELGMLERGRRRGVYIPSVHPDEAAE